MLKQDRFFVVSARDGTVDARRFKGDGVWSGDTRILSRLRLLINGVEPALVRADTEDGWAAFHLSSGPLRVTRLRYVDRGLREKITVRNSSTTTVDALLQLDAAADFAAMLAVRGIQGLPPAIEVTPAPTEAGVLFSRGGDNQYTSLAICQPPGLRHQIVLRPDEAFELVVEVVPQEAGSSIDFAQGLQAAKDAYPRWAEECMSVETDNPRVNAVLARAAADIRMLCNRYDTGIFPTGGLPWYAVPFGRDTLITSMHLLPFNPDVARGVLRFLAAHQGRRFDDDSEEQPGKILHEVRTGEVVERGLWPHVLYGDIDCSALFLCLLAELESWTADSTIVDELWPAAEAALEWCFKYGDSDGDGYIEYHGNRARNQGWKDSDDSLTNVDGTDAQRPAALCEVQAYLYRGLVGMSARRPELKRRAVALKRAFNRDFWMTDEGYLAQALDGSKRLVKAIKSNPGHCLWMGALTRAHGSMVARRLASPALFSGWGVRTLSERAVNYDPCSYHNGSVWPFDSAIAAAGLRAYGDPTRAEMVARALFDAAFTFPLQRPPELFCGDPREQGKPPREYWNTCAPQLWSAAAMFQLVSTLLGLKADARRRRLTVSPVSTGLWSRIQVRGLHFASERVDFSVEGTTVRTTRLPAGVTVNSG